MKEITIAVLKDAAKRLMFDMSEAEYQTLYEEFGVLTKQMDLIGMIEGVDECTPMTFPFDCSRDALREDISGDPLPVSEVLRNAAEVMDNQIKLPKVVG